MISTAESGTAHTPIGEVAIPTKMNSHTPTMLALALLVGVFARPRLHSQASKRLTETTTLNKKE